MQLANWKGPEISYVPFLNSEQEEPLNKSRMTNAGENSELLTFWLNIM
jgi:hypothetical protein